MNSTTLRPEFVLSDFYPSETILNPRSSYRGSDWSSPEQAQLDFLTGRPSSISGSLPMICSSADPEFDLLQELVDQSWLFPTNIYDPRTDAAGSDDLRVQCLLFGSSKFQVEQRIRHLQAKFTSGSGALARAKTVEPEMGSLPSLVMNKSC